MKHSIKLLATGLLLSTAFVAASPAKPARTKISSMKKMVTFSALPSKRGIEIKLNKLAPGKATVMIYNWDNDVIWKDALSPEKRLARGYILSQLDNGNYTVEVMLDKQMVAKKTAHVYYRGDTKFVQLRS
jgi:hypothetical protein